MPAWIPYTVLRLVLFGATFALIHTLLIQHPMRPMVAPLIAAVGAMIVSLTVAYIFFPKLRNRVSQEFAESRERSKQRAQGVLEIDERGVDELAEDDTIDDQPVGKPDDQPVDDK